MSSVLAILLPIALFELAVILLVLVVYRTMAAEERSLERRESHRTST